MTIHADAFSGGAEQRQQNDGEGVQEKQSVAPLRIGDAENAHAHAEAKVLGIAKSRLDRPALGVIVLDLARGRLGAAARQTPGLLHVFGLDTDDRPDLVAARRTSTSRSLRDRPPAPTHSAAVRVSLSQAVTWMLPRNRIT
jgi:hypothetical protein